MVRTGLARNLPKIHTSNYCVAYLDILGASKFMQEDDDVFLNNLNSIYFDAINDISFTSLVSKKDIQVKIFSDNILLAIEIKEDDELRTDKIEKIINLAGNIYNNALCHGYLMRGAITEGDFYKDENNVFVYGKALIDAVETEEKLAIYPRIVVQQSIQEALPQYFTVDVDGCSILNNFIFAPGLPETYKINLLGIFKKYYKNNKIKQKIMWVINHYNLYYGTSEHIDCPIITEEELKKIKTEEQKV